MCDIRSPGAAPRAWVSSQCTHWGRRVRRPVSRPVFPNARRNPVQDLARRSEARQGKKNDAEPDLRRSGSASFFFPCRASERRARSCTGFRRAFGKTGRETGRRTRLPQCVHCEDTQARGAAPGERMSHTARFGVHALRRRSAGARRAGTGIDVAPRRPLVRRRVGPSSEAVRMKWIRRRCRAASKRTARTRRRCRSGRHRS